MRKNSTFIKRALIISTAVILTLILQVNCFAATKAEFLSELFTALNYTKLEKPILPPDVPPTHKSAAVIGSAVKYGLIDRGTFSPDEQINRHNAVLLSLKMMGWGFEASLYESLATLPDLGGSGDSLFFLAAEMQPSAPQELLMDGLTPLSDSGKSALISWVRSCKRSVTWNRVMSFSGTDLIIYRQGVARPGEPNLPKQSNPVGSEECEPLYIAAVAVQQSAVDIRIAFAEKTGLGRAPLSQFVNCYDSIAAINGGFFSGGRPLGTMLLDGVFAGKTIPGRSAFGWNNSSGESVYGSGNVRVGIRTDGGYAEFNRFNVAPDANEMSLYTSGVTQSAAGTAQDALELVVRGETVTERREAALSNRRVPDDGVLIVARGMSRSLLEGIQPGANIKITADWATGAFQSCTDLIQAGPMLLRNDQFMTNTETFKPDVLDKRHPRTLVGSDGERTFWVVIDGRSSLRSRGTTIAETRWVAKALGLKDALNMDGGGSSQLVWRGITMNRPSDGRERPLPYAVLMLPKGASLVRREGYNPTPASPAIQNLNNQNLDQGEFGPYGEQTSDLN